jgi:hypothetical protein
MGLKLERLSEKTPPPPPERRPIKPKPWNKGNNALPPIGADFHPAFMSWRPHKQGRSSAAPKKDEETPIIYWAFSRSKGFQMFFKKENKKCANVALEHRVYIVHHCLRGTYLVQAKRIEIDFRSRRSIPTPLVRWDIITCWRVAAHRWCIFFICWALVQVITIFSADSCCMRGQPRRSSCRSAVHCREPVSFVRWHCFLGQWAGPSFVLAWEHHTNG